MRTWRQTYFWWHWPLSQQPVRWLSRPSAAPAPGNSMSLAVGTCSHAHMQQTHTYTQVKVFKCVFMPSYLTMCPPVVLDTFYYCGTVGTLHIQGSFCFVKLNILSSLCPSGQDNCHSPSISTNPDTLKNFTCADSVCPSGSL